MSPPDPTRRFKDDRVEIYRATGGGWNWRKVAPNNEVIAESGDDDFVDRNNAKEGAIRANPDVKLDHIVYEED